MYPEIQTRAQKELDNYLGSTRLPDHEDREHLPYCQALLMEVLRWRPAVPLGIPHRLMVEDWYDGYHLPAGSMIVPVSTSLRLVARSESLPIECLVCVS